MRLRPTERLKKRQDFLAVQNGGEKFHLDQWLVFLREHAGQRRIGITVSRKVGGAVVRNRLKRLVRENWRYMKELFPDQLDVVFVAKRAAATANYAQVTEQMARLARRLSGRLRKSNSA